MFLAKKAIESGCIVMFEPYRLDDIRKARKAIAISDILKYAEDEGNSPLDDLITSDSHRPRLIVETMGALGLKFRWRGKNRRLSSWLRQAPFHPTMPLDSAGAGDWCSAGFIKKLLNGRPDLRWNRRYIERALRYGQALAAGSVSFLGPRAYAECVAASDIHRAALSTLKEKKVPHWVSESQIDFDTIGLNKGAPFSACTYDVCAFCLQGAS